MTFSVNAPKIELHGRAYAVQYDLCGVGCMSTSKQSGNNWKVGSVGKALAILNSFDIGHSEQSLAQISAKIGVPKSTTYN